jgi:predicted ATPase
MRTANPVKEVRHIGLMGEDLAAFLNTLRSVDPKQLKAIARSLHAIIPSVTGVEAAPNDLGEVEIKILEGDAVIPARVVSEGTLRVLGLLSLGSTREPLSLVGFEEPENGIHPRRIRMIAELLKSRAEQHAGQLIVTTHSPLLPDLIPDENLYVCRKTEGQTRITPFASWGEIARRATIDGALEETGEGAKTPVSARILRGDFDA